MRRIRYHSYGGPEVLTLEEVPVPVPEAGQVLIRAEAIGANFVDTQLRRGMAQTELYPRPLPRSLTGDVVGTVEAVGPDTDPALIGQQVATASEDAFCDLILADAQWLVPVPDGLDAGTASALPMVAPVALGVLHAGRLAPGETVLVHRRGRHRPPRRAAREGTRCGYGHRHGQYGRQAGLRPRPRRRHRRQLHR